MSRVDLAELRRLLSEIDLTGDGWISRSMIVVDALPALLDELEAARLEMRRQGSVIAESREEVRRLTQANGDLRQERDRAVAEAQRQYQVAKGLRQDRTALAAHVERLVSVIGCFLRDAKRAIPMADDTWPDWYCCLCGVVGAHDDECTYPFAEAALTATPTQSLAAHDAAVKVAVLREVARMLGAQQRELLMAEADRIEKEAGDGKA